MAVPFLVWWKAQALSDWWALRNYSPPSPIESLASQDTMTDYARHVFYVNHPDLQSNISQFRSDCSIAEQAIVLGCYHSNQDGIFIYDVSDPRLDGVEQVTAAHEMLHGAYDRLSNSDKENVNSMLQAFYNSLKDQRVIDEINSYKETEPDDVVNEMHSVFGTEVANLPSGLEKYYARYFSDRGTVTGFADDYQKEFTSREAKIKADDAKLAQMKLQINNLEASLQAQLNQINSDRAKLDAERSNGDAKQYNSDVAAFNAKVNTYNRGVDQLKALIASYNHLVKQRNAVASQLASLSKALDTRLVQQSPQ